MNGRSSQSGSLLPLLERRAHVAVFFEHYDQYVDRYFIFDNGSTDQSLAMLEQHGRVEIAHFDVPGDSFVDEERRLGDTIWKGSDADWVIVTDIDEHIFHPDLLGYLRRLQDEGVTAIQSIGYEWFQILPFRNRFPGRSCD